MELTTAFTDSWHRPPNPAGWDKPPANTQWVLISAVWLLAMWSPDRLWTPILVPGRASSRQDQQWPEPPPLPQIAEFSGLANVTGATVLTSRVSSAPGQPYEQTRTDEEVAAELATLISAAAPVPNQRSEALIAFLADHLAHRYSDVLQLTTGPGDSAEPDSFALQSATGTGEPAQVDSSVLRLATGEAGQGGPDSLHLLHRDSYGSTLRVSFEPGAGADLTPSFAFDGPDALLRTRIACVLTLLSDMLWLNNNSPVTFQFRTGRLDPGAGGPLAGAARWWSRNREDPQEHEEEEFHPLSAADLRAGLRNEVRLNLSELFDGQWSGIEEFPEVPSGHLSLSLADDLIDLILARMGDGAQIACAGFLPVTWPPAEEFGDDLRTVIAFVAGQEIATLEIDLTC